ncbi:hypothetical protein [Williamsia sp. M5A3_1d]
MARPEAPFTRVLVIAYGFDGADAVLGAAERVCSAGACDAVEVTVVTVVDCAAGVPSVEEHPATTTIAPNAGMAERTRSDRFIRQA